jgi:hypothetical protein
MMRFVSVFAVMCVLFACSSGNGLPDDVIPPEKMKFIVMDVLRAQEYVIMKYAKDTNVQKANMPVMLQQVFDIYKIKKDDFYRSFQYYEAHPDKNKILFDSLTAYAQRKRQEMYMKMR